MRFRLIVRWPSNSILPTTYDYESAREALQKYRALITSGTAFVSIFSVRAGYVTGGVAAVELAKLARSENMVVKTFPRRSHGAIRASHRG
jgi:hypothetical protein